MNEQIGNLSNRLRNDRTLELAARREWTKMCRSIPLGAAAAGAPALWLEMRPTKAFAAQPRIVPDWVILTVGVQAETRIVPNATKPDCPFPARLELVPQLDQGNVNDRGADRRAVHRAQPRDGGAAQGQDLPGDGNAPGQVTVLAANIAASGDRLLISLRVKAQGDQELVRPRRRGDRARLGQARARPREPDHAAHRHFARRASPRRRSACSAPPRARPSPICRTALAENAVVDLKPFAANARKSIEAAIADFQKPVDGVEVEAGVTGLRLVGIEFDSKHAARDRRGRRHRPRAGAQDRDAVGDLSRRLSHVVQLGRCAPSL